MSTNTIHMIPTRLFIMSLWRHVRLISPLLLRVRPIPRPSSLSLARLRRPRCRRRPRRLSPAAAVVVVAAAACNDKYGGRFRNERLHKLRVGAI